MDRDPKSDGSRLANKPTHLGFVGMYICQELGIWARLGEEFSNEALVQAEDWALRFNSNLSSISLACRM